MLIMEDRQDCFRRAFGAHPSGVAVLAADDGSGPVAMTVTSLISISAAPPTVAFSLSAQSASAGPILAAGSLVIHMLRTEDQPLAALCATKGADRFADPASWTRLPTGEPRFCAVRTWFRATIRQCVDTSGATLVLAELSEGEVATTQPETPLVYCNRQWFGVSVLA